MNLYLLHDVTDAFDERGGIAMAVIAAESEEDARLTKIIDTHHGENQYLDPPRYACDLIGTTSLPAGVVCVDHDYDYLRVGYPHRRVPVQRW